MRELPSLPSARVSRLPAPPAASDAGAAAAGHGYRRDAVSLILPMFVREGVTEPQPIRSMPGVVQHTLDSLTKAAHDAIEAGVGGLMLFGVPAGKDARGSGADAPDGVLNRALHRLRREFGDATVLMADLCLDEFTDHGHCGCSTRTDASTMTPRSSGTSPWELRKRRRERIWSVPAA